MKKIRIANFTVNLIRVFIILSVSSSVPKTDKWLITRIRNKLNPLDLIGVIEFHPIIVCP